MDEKAVLQALDTYPATIIASHANAAALLKGVQSNRHLSDRVIKGLLERDGVIGIVPFNRFLQAGWTAKDGKESVTLEKVVAQNGGFGVQGAPAEIDTIADLRKIGPLLADRGYSDTEIAQIFGENWLSVLLRTWSV